MLELTIDEHVILRNLHPDSSQELFDLIEQNRPRLRPWVIPYFLPETYKATRQLAIHCLFDYYGPGGDPNEIYQYVSELEDYFSDDLVSLTFELRFQNELIGIVQMANMPDAAEAFSFGYWVAQSYQGRGVITRSVKKLMEYAVNHLPVHRFSIFCAAENLRSRAVPERLGYRLYAIRPTKEFVGEFVYDQAVYGIRAEDFKKMLQECL